MASQNILTIDISNVNFNSEKFRMVGKLTLDKVKIKYNWIFNAQIKDAVIGEDDYGLVWYSGTWVNGTWEDGTWYSGTFLNGRWKNGNVYSYDIDEKSLYSDEIYIYRSDITKTHFVNCSFEGGKFNYGIFGNIKNIDNLTLPYKIDRDYIITNIEDYDIDNGFNTGCNIGFYLDDSLENQIKTVAIDKDNKVILGGCFSKYNEITANSIIRLNYDGTVDNDFNGGFNYGAIINSITIDNNNKILIGGHFTSYNKKSVNSIIRLNYDGSIDETFTMGNGFIDISGNTMTVNTIAVDSNDFIYIGGDFTRYNDKNISKLIKINSDGILSTGTTFTNDITFDGDVNIITIHNNRLYIGGEFNKYLNKFVYKFVRTYLNGEIDYNFSSKGFFGEYINAIDFDSHDNIYVGGKFTQYDCDNISSPQVVNNIIGLKSDGTINTDFLCYGASHGITNNDNSAWVNSIKVDKYDVVNVGGCFTHYNSVYAFNFTRMTPNGEIDPTLDNESGTFNNNINDNTENVVTVLNIDIVNHKLYLGGKFNVYNGDKTNLIARINRTGTLNNVDNQIFMNTNLNRSIFKNGEFYDGLFNSSIFENGNFYNGYMNNAIWKLGNFYNGEFLSGEWYDGNFFGGIFSNGNWHNGIFSSINNDITTSFGLNYKNKKVDALNWYNGSFLNGNFYSYKYEEINKILYPDETGTTFIISDNNLVHWYNGSFNNGVWYNGTFHNGDFNSGIMYDGHILNITFNNGHIVNTICENGIFNNGSIGGGIYKNITINNLDIGYEI